MSSRIVSGSLSVFILLVSTNNASAYNEPWLASKGLKRTETAEKRLRNLYNIETNKAAQQANKNAKSFVPVSYDQWKSNPPGTFAGYPSTYDGSGN